MIRNRILFSFLLTITFIISGCGQSSTSSTTSLSELPEEVKSQLPSSLVDKEEVHLMVIRKIGGDDHTAQYLAGAKAEGESLGFTVDTFSANGDSAKFHDAIAQALEKEYDGIILSHGDDPATVDDVKKITDQGIPVVTFDSLPELAEIPNVTVTSQDDEALATFALDHLIDNEGEDAKIAYLWVDGFPPMVRRNAVYQTYLEEYPSLTEVERFGIAAEDTSVQTQNAVSAMLTKYPEGELDAIFATWDAFAIGAARAIKEAGRDDVKIYGIDVSNADLQVMQEDESAWVSTAAVDPKMIGAVNVRLVAKKIAGEETPQEFHLEASNIDRETLITSENPVNMDNLADILPGWGETDAFQEPWMQSLKDYYNQTE
ncbi:sugar ABC transporter substrate-binding protein [Aureibacillus halotolerans]|uniref:Monosaccharide ABC transporter substrate-binding protein (CUT2 family) n=1 Tax=Aureibacillus halotolerans TaxID=1508390 RepID=A0A4R6UC61_9BACI|nr:sugar ABC transporter substrate-binding protein [Aureibacillus halotolerans]TDQ42673.1 monosaccharide ABC transporter substrate-binding protein (CUT2 family) [Aureibacillus halotolerans]